MSLISNTKMKRKEKKSEMNETGQHENEEVDDL